MEKKREAFFDVVYVYHCVLSLMLNVWKKGAMDGVAFSAFGGGRWWWAVCLLLLWGGGDFLFMSSRVKTPAREKRLPACLPTRDCCNAAQPQKLINREFPLVLCRHSSID